MAQARGIRLHQYLWLIRSISWDKCLHDTQTLLSLCQELGWLVNVQKSELIPKQVFDFVGYQYDLVQGVVRPKTERWHALNQKMRFLQDAPFCTVRQMMSHWASNSYRKTGSCGASSHAPHSMTPHSLHLKWWTEEANVLPAQHLHPLQHALQLFTDT